MANEKTNFKCPDCPWKKSIVSAMYKDGRFSTDCIINNCTRSYWSDEQWQIKEGEL